MANRFKVDAEFRAIDKVTMPITRMQNRVNQFTRSMAGGLRRADRQLSKFTSGLKKAAIVGAVAFTAIAAAGKDIVEVGADFGRQIGIASIKFQIDRGTLAYEELAAAARKVGLDTEVTATRAAEGLKILSAAGFSAEFAMAKLMRLVDFSTVAEMDFAEATTAAVDALGSFGLRTHDAVQDGKNLARVMDVLTVAANQGNTTISQMSEAIANSGPSMVMVGMTVEEFAATLSMLGSSGIKATKAGTAMKNITAAMAGVGNQARATFRALGIPMTDMHGNVRRIVDIFKDLQRVTKNMGTGKVMNIMNAIFGKIGVPAAGNLLRSGPDEIMRRLPALIDAAGVLERQAAFIRDDTRGSLDRLRSAIEAVKLSVFTLKEGPFRELVDLGVEWLKMNEQVVAKDIAEFFTRVGKAIGFIVVHRVAIFKVVAAFTALIVVLKVLIGALTLINLLMAMNPIGLIIIGIGLLIAAVIALVFWWKEIVAWLQNTSTAFKILLGALLVLFGPLGILIAVAAAIILAWEPVKAFFIDLFNVIGNEADRAFDRLLRFAAQGVSLAARFGLISGEDDQRASSHTFAPRIVGPEARAAASRSDSAEVTIKTAEGAEAVVSAGSLGPGLSLISTGAP